MVFLRNICINTLHEGDNDNDNNNNNYYFYKYTILPVIIGATRIVTRSLRKNLEDIPRTHSIDALQKTATPGSSHIRNTESTAV
jgi:hypothetical protein